MTTHRTSLSDPLYIDWIAGIVSGRVGITIAPGKQSTSLHMPDSVWRRDLGTDLATLHLRQARGPNCPENSRQLAYLERFATRSRSR